MLNRVAIAIGSNLGDRRRTVELAVERLREQAGIRNLVVSRWIDTCPVGGPEAQGTYLNGAMTGEVAIPAELLLQRMQAIETELGRTRNQRWESRTLDLDLLLYGSQVIDGPGLIVPHPRMTLRRFVLGPLAEIGPNLVEPLSGQTIQSLLENLDRTPRGVGLVGWNAAELPPLIAAVPADWNTLVVTDAAEPLEPRPIFLAAPWKLRGRQPRFDSAGQPAPPVLYVRPDDAPLEIAAACQSILAEPRRANAQERL